MSEPGHVNIIVNKKVAVFARKTSNEAFEKSELLRPNFFRKWKDNQFNYKWKSLKLHVVGTNNRLT